MFEIELTGAGKRYNRHWVFRGIDRVLRSGDSLAVLGGNGSGKSTFIRSLIGFSPLSEGGLTHRSEGKPLNPGAVYRHVSFCSPYLELYEELTLAETAEFHFSLKPPRAGITTKNFAEVIGLKHAADKAVHHFSSGMKQRLRIGLALLSAVDAVFLDEPTSNLDRAGEAWYEKMVAEHLDDRLVVVASNHRETEYSFCKDRLEIEDFQHESPTPRQ